MTYSIEYMNKNENADLLQQFPTGKFPVRLINQGKNVKTEI